MKGDRKGEKEDDIPYHVVHQDVFFAKKLAHNEKKVRDQALRKLATWLEARDTFSEMEMMKVWKGLFYCFWHSDKPLVQMELAEQLSGLLFVFKDSVDLSCLFIQTFFNTIQREWVGIDRLRLDKFMLFIRFFIRHVFVYLGAKNGWEGELCMRVMDIFTEHGVGKLVRKNALGFLYHLADIYLTEWGVVLRSVEKKKFDDEKKKKAAVAGGKKGGKKGKKEEEEEEEDVEMSDGGFELADKMSPEVFCLILTPFLDVVASSEERTCVQRVHKSVFYELLANMEEKMTVPAPEGTPPFFTHIRPENKTAILKALSEKVFQVASNGESTLDKNRRRLYTYRERLQKEAEKYKLDETFITPERQEEEEEETTPPSSKKRKRAGRVPTPHPVAEQMPTAADADPAEPRTTRARKRLNQDLDQAASSSSSSSPSSSSSSPIPSSPTSSTSSLVDDVDAFEEEIAGRTRAKKKRKTDSTVLSTPKNNQFGSPVTPVAKKEKKKGRVYFDLGKNKVQEAKEALKHHPPAPSPLKVPASPAMRATPKKIPCPSQISWIVWCFS